MVNFMRIIVIFSNFKNSNIVYPLRKLPRAICRDFFSAVMIETFHWKYLIFFLIFARKHGIRIHVRTALEQKYEKIGYPVYSSLTK